MKHSKTYYDYLSRLTWKLTKKKNCMYFKIAKKRLNENMKHFHNLLDLKNKQKQVANVEIKFKPVK